MNVTANIAASHAPTAKTAVIVLAGGSIAAAADGSKRNAPALIPAIRDNRCFRTQPKVHVENRSPEGHSSFLPELFFC